MLKFMKLMTMFAMTSMAAMMLATSCDKVQPVSENNETKEERPLEKMIMSKSDNEPMLSFDSNEDFFATVKEVTEMSPAMFDQWVESQGDFVSQWSFMDVINAEMAPVKSWEEALSIMSKYEGMYIFNPNEKDLDGEPYCPVSKKVYSYLLNKFGDVRIAGKVVNFNDLKTFDDIEKANPKTRAWNYNSGAINEVQHQAGRARYQVTSRTVEIPLVGNVHELYMRHQYKEWFVWIGGPTTWHVRSQYYYWPGVKITSQQVDGTTNRWEPFRRPSGTVLFVARGEHGPLNISAKIWFMTTSLKEEKPLVIRHQQRGV